MERRRAEMEMASRWLSIEGDEDRMREKEKPVKGGRELKRISLEEG